MTIPINPHGIKDNPPKGLGCMMLPVSFLLILLMAAVFALDDWWTRKKSR